MWGAKPPTYLKAFPGPRDRPDLKSAPPKIRPDCLQVPRVSCIVPQGETNPSVLKAKISMKNTRRFCETRAWRRVGRNFRFMSPPPIPHPPPPPGQGGWGGGGGRACKRKRQHMKVCPTVKTQTSAPHWLRSGLPTSAKSWHGPSRKALLPCLTWCLQETFG